MKQEEVVVRRSEAAGEPARTGALLGRDGHSLSVRWDDDGREEVVRLSNTTSFAVRGSLRHQWLVDPEGLAERLAEQLVSDPVSLVAQVLREYPASMDAHAIKDQLVRYGLDREAVAGAWRRAQGRLRDLNNVRLKKNKYVWTGSRVAPPEEEAAAPGEVESAASGSLDGFGAADLGRPLAAGVRLGGMSDSEVERLVSDRPEVLPLLLARPRATPGVDAPPQAGLLGQEVVGGLLAAASGELRGNGADDAGLREAAAWLLRRVVGAEVPLGVFVELASQAAVGGGSEVLDDVARGLGERLRGLPPGERDGVDLDALARFRAQIGEGVIAPILRHELNAVSERSQLMRLLALPGTFVEQLPAGDVAAAFRRVADGDPYVAAWLAALES